MTSVMWLWLLEKKHVVKLKEGGKHGQKWDEGDDVLLFLVKVLEDIPHEGVVDDRGAEIGKGISDSLLSRH
jgi:hypothetical protein